MSNFGEIGFSGKLRPSQLASSDIIRKQLDAGEKNLHIVAPPGSGKTVLGLYTWSDLVRSPTLVLSPNSAIQAQWVARAKELFNLDGKEDQILTNTNSPGLLTSLTYQSVTLPKRADKNLDDAAMKIWINKLISENEADSVETAKAWIKDLEDNNNDYFTDRFSSYRKQVRDDFASHGNALWVLHESSKKNLENLAKTGYLVCGLCHSHSDKEIDRRVVIRKQSEA